jgi:hypothetical protein
MQPGRNKERRTHNAKEIRKDASALAGYKYILGQGNGDSSTETKEI